MPICKRSILSYILNHPTEMNVGTVPEMTLIYEQTEVSDRWEASVDPSRRRKVTIVDQNDDRVDAPYRYEGDLLVVEPNPPMMGKIYLN